MIIGIHGAARSGKDTFAGMLMDILLKEASTEVYRVAFADPFKRFLQDVLELRDEQVWGDNKEEGDPRYALPNGELLSPRVALQRMGTDVSRMIYEPIWVEYLGRVARRLQAGSHIYTQKSGLLWRPMNMKRAQRVVVLVPDVRHDNEAALIKELGGTILHIVRKGSGLQGKPQAHSSERGIDPKYIDREIPNDGYLSDLELFAYLEVEALREKENAVCGLTNEQKNGPISSSKGSLVEKSTSTSDSPNPSTSPISEESTLTLQEVTKSDGEPSQDP